jgi:hypothetical protein
MIVDEATSVSSTGMHAMDDDAPAAVFLGAWDRGSANRRSQCQRDIEDERHHVTSTRLSWVQMRCHCSRLFVFRVEARALFGGNCARESSNLTRFRTHDRRYKHSPGVVTADAMVGCNVPHGECNIDRVDCDGVQQWVR